MAINIKPDIQKEADEMQKQLDSMIDLHSDIHDIQNEKGEYTNMKHFLYFIVMAWVVSLGAFITFLPFFVLVKWFFN